MNKSKLRLHRIHSGFTQEELAAESNISIKTIQRIESGESIGSTHSIKALSQALGISHNELLSSSVDETSLLKDKVKKLNLSALIGLIIPFGSLITPLQIALRNKDELYRNDVVKRIISFHLLWSIFSIIMSLGLTFIAYNYESIRASSIPIIIPSYYLLALINACFVLFFSHKLSNKESLSFLPNLL